MKKTTKISVLISLLLISILAIGAVSAAEDTAITDDADLAAVDDVQTVDDAPTTDEINYESNDIVVTDTGDSGDSNAISDTEEISDSDAISDSEEISDNAGLQVESDDGSDAVVTDVARPKNVLKAEIEPDEPLGAPDGTFADLQTLINNARSGSTITLDRNYVYTARTDTNYRTGITIDKSITIEGAGFTIDGGDTARIFYLDGGGYFNNFAINLNNINLVNGYAYNRNSYGGVIYAYNRPTLTINNCNITSSGGSNALGGVVYVASGTTTILHSELVNNTASYGGVFYLAGGTLNIHGSAILNNTAPNGDNGYTNGNGNFNLEENWWGENHGPGYTFLNQRGSYYTNYDYYILTETLTTPITVEVDMVLDSGNTPTYLLDPRYAKVSHDADTCNTTEGWVPEAFTIEFTTGSDAYINVTVDNQHLALKVFAGENKKNITELRVVVDNVTLPDQPIAYIYSDVDGEYNLTLGSQVIPVNVTDGEGSYQFTGLNVGQYNVIVSRVDDPVYKTTFNSTSFEVKRYATQLTIDTETPNPTYGTDVTITHELTPGRPSGTITYYVDGSETGTQLDVGEDFVLTGLAAGTHTVVAVYGGDGTYDISESDSLTIVVVPATLEFNVTNVTINYPNKGTVNVTSNADGVYNVSVNNVNYEVTVANGKGSFEVDQDLAVGQYPIIWDIPAGNYTAASGLGLYNVTAPAPEFDITGTAQINYGQSNTITHTITEGAIGTISYTVNGDDYGTKGLNEVLVLEGLEAGHYVVVAAYSGGGNYGPTSDEFEFDVLPIDVSVTVTSPEVLYPNTGTINLTASAPGQYTVKVGDKTYTANVVTAGVPVEVAVEDVFQVGAYDISVTADLGDNYNPVDTGKIGTYTVTKPSTSVVIDVTDFTYGADASATITLKQGETPLAGKTLNVTIGGTQKTVTTDADGTASVPLSSFNAGKYNIVAIFEGDDNYAYAYNVTEFNVTKANPTIGVTANAINYGENATISITLDGVNSEKITGIVKVTINEKDYDVAVNNGAGTLTVSGLAANVEGYAITAAFAGNENYNAATNTDAKQVVNKATPAVTIAANATKIKYGENVSLSVEGVPADYAGTITYYMGEYDVPSIVEGLAVGTYTFTAELSGDGNYSATASSNTVTVTVDKADPTIVVSANATSVKYGESIQLSALVTPGADHGEIVYFVDGWEHGSVVSDIGTHTVYAKVLAYGPYNEAVSENITITIEKADATITLSADKEEITYGETITLSSVVSPAGATGAVTYTIDGNETGAEISVDKLTAGTHTVVAKYAGNENYTAAEDQLTITVKPAKADVTVTVDPVTYPDVATVVVNSNVPGTYTIRVGNKDYAVVVGDTGSGSTVIDKLEPGTYDVALTADLGDNYEPVVLIPATTLTVNAQTGPFVVRSNGLGYATLEEALAVAEEGDTITVVEEGTYTGEGNIGVTINKDITIQAAKGLEVIFDAKGADTNILTIAHDKTVTLGSLEFTGVDNTATKYGAIVNHGELTVFDCYIHDNLVHVAGTGGSNGAAAIFNAPDAQGLAVLQSNISNNKATSPSFNTGGIAAVASWAPIAVLIQDSYFEANDARFGSALEFENLNQEPPCVVNCTFVENRGYIGAAINFNDGCQYEVVTGCTFIENYVVGPQGAPTTGAMGGAICAGSNVAASTLVVTDSKFIGNKDDGTEGSCGGAIRLADKASGIITNCEFTDNVGRVGSAISAGTINNEQATLKVEKCNFTNNEATIAGAISTSPGISSTITESIFSGNTAPDSRNIYDLAESITIENNVFDVNDTEIKVNDIPYGENEVINGTFDAGVNFDLIGATVSLTIGEEAVTAPVGEGNTFTTTVEKPNIGTYNVVFEKVTDSKNNEYIPEKAVVETFTVTKANLTIVVVPNATSINVGDEISLDKAITAPEGALITGDVTYYLDGVALSSTTLSDLTAGTHNVMVKVTNDPNYNDAESALVNITVNKLTPTVSIVAAEESFEYGADVKLNITVKDGDKGVTGKVVVSIAGTDYSIDVTDGVGQAIVKGLSNDTYTATAKFIADDMYNEASAEAPATVIVNATTDTAIIANGSEVTYGEDSTVTISVVDAAGNPIEVSKIIINETEYDVSNGVATIPKLDVGTYVLPVVFDDGSHKVVETEVTLKVVPAVATISANAENYVFDETGALVITVKDADGNGLEGNVTVSIDRKEYAVEAINGEVTIDLKDLSAGVHDVDIAFASANYVADPGYTSFTALQKTPTVTIVAAEESFAYGEDVLINVTVKDGENPVSGTVLVNIGGTDYYVDLTNGAGQATVKGLSNGTYKATAQFKGNVNYTEATSEAPADVVVNASTDAIITATGSEVTYGEDSTIDISIVDGAGNPVDVASVSIGGKDYEVVNGKVTYDKLDVGNHTVTVEFDDGFHKPVSADVTLKVVPAAATISASAENYVFDETGALVITVKDADGNGLEGTVTVSIDRKEYAAQAINGEVTIDLKDLSAGVHDVDIAFTNSNYVADPGYTSFTALQKTPTVTIVAAEESFAYGEDVLINVTVKDGENPVSGTVLVNIGGTEYSVDLVEGAGQATVKGLSNGTHEATAKFTGNTNYTEASSSAPANVLVNASTDASITATGSEVTYGEDSTVEITVVDGAGNPIEASKVKINGTEYDVVEGKVTIPNLDVGTHILPVEFDDGIHKVANTEVTLIVKPISAEITAVAANYAFDETGKLTITVKDTDGNNIKGTVTVTIDGAEYATETIDGTLEVTLENLATGLHNVEVAFAGENYAASPAKTTFNVTKKTPTVSITVDPATIKQTESTTVKVSLVDGDKKLDGTVVVTVAGVDYSVDVSAGEGSVTISNLAPANYTVTAKFAGNENYTEAIADSQKLEVTKVAKVDLNVSAEGNNIVIKLTDEDGKPVDGKVNVTIDGKTQEVTVTNGVAKVPTTTGNHNVTVVYPGDAVHGGTKVVNNIVNVNPKTVKIKTYFTVSRMKVPTYNKYLDNLKDYYIYVTLKDANGKPLVGKTVKYASHGKTVTRKTNSKGQIRFYVAHTPSGMCNRAVSFIGDSKYNASFKTIGVKIYRQKVKLVAKKKTFKATKKVKKLTATLKNLKGKKIGGRKIVFIVNGKKYTAKTNKKGVATVKVKLKVKKTYKVTVKFAGDRTFKKATKKTSVKIK